MNEYIEINGRRIGPGEPVYIIAEMSANHCQDYDLAVEIIRAAKDAGADAVKLQTYTPDELTIDSDKEYFKISGGTPWDSETLYDLYERAHMPWEWQPELKKTAESLGMDFFSTCAGVEALEFLETLNVPVHKLPSLEIDNIPLIEAAAGTGKPLILSTGIARYNEIEEAVSAFREAGGEQLFLMKCTSAYPAKPEDMNLRTIPKMAADFGVPTGLSDHTPGTAVPAAGVALGACAVEKHFTVSRNKPSPDGSFSLEPDEFSEMVKTVRIIEKALGKATYDVGEQAERNRMFLRSLYAVEDIGKGAVFSEANVRSIRPRREEAMKDIGPVIGKTAKKNIKRGTPLVREMVEGMEE